MNSALAQSFDEREQIGKRDSAFRGELMLARQAENARIGLLGVLSGGVSVMLVCAVLSQADIHSAAKQDILTRPAIGRANVVPCIYTAATGKERAGDEAGFMPVSCSSEQALGESSEQPAEAPLYGADDHTADDYGVTEGVSLYGAGAPANSDGAVLVYPEDDSRCGQEADAVCDATAICESDCGGEFAAEAGTAGLDQSCDSDSRSTSFAEPVAAVPTKLQAKSIERVCSLREVDSRSVVATVRIFGSVKSEELPETAASESQPATSTQSPTHSQSPTEKSLATNRSANPEVGNYSAWARTPRRADGGDEECQAPNSEYFLQRSSQQQASRRRSSQPRSMMSLPEAPAIPSEPVQEPTQTASSLRAEENQQPAHLQKAVDPLSLVTPGGDRGRVRIRFDRATQRVTIGVQQASLGEVLQRVQAETGEQIMLTGETARVTQQVISGSWQGPTLLEALRAVLAEQQMDLRDDMMSGCFIAQASEQVRGNASQPLNRDSDVRQVAFSGAQQVQPRRPETGMKRSGYRLPEPWEIVEQQLTANDDVPPAVPPGVESATVNPKELAVAKRARALIARGSLDETIDLLSGAAVELADSAMLFRMLGEAYMWRGDYQAAAQALEHSISLNKMDPLSNNLFAETLMKLGQADRADHYRHQALDMQRAAQTSR